MLVLDERDNADFKQDKIWKKFGNLFISQE